MGFSPPFGNCFQASSKNNPARGAGGGGGPLPSAAAYMLKEATDRMVSKTKFCRCDLMYSPLPEIYIFNRKPGIYARSLNCFYLSGYSDTAVKFILLKP